MTGLLKLGWQPALAAVMAFAFVTWVNPGTTPGAILLFAVAALSALVLIAGLRFVLARRTGGEAAGADAKAGKDITGRDTGKDGTGPDAPG